MNPVSSKRPRSTNFSVFETECLVEEVLKRAAVIENKKTDAVTWKMKEEAWKQVTESFNAITAGTRNVKNLKSKYECIKSTIKKKHNAVKSEQFKTGGGTATTTLLTPWEEKILQLILLSVEGLPSRNDCDQSVNYDTVKLAPVDVCETVNVDHDTVKLAPVDVCETVNVDHDTVNLIVPVPEVLETVNVDHYDTVKSTAPEGIKVGESETNKRKWGSWSPATLRTPKNKKFKTNPIVNNYKNIADSREELIALQKRVAEQELIKLSIEIENLKNVDKRAELEHNLRMEILEKQKALIK